LKKALAGLPVFDSFRAPPPNGIETAADIESALSEKVEENSKFPLTAESEPLRFPSRHKRWVCRQNGKLVLPTSGTSD
jgi:hypothetical protein